MIVGSKGLRGGHLVRESITDREVKDEINGDDADDEQDGGENLCETFHGQICHHWRRTADEVFTRQKSTVEPDIAGRKSIG